MINEVFIYMSAVAMVLFSEYVIETEARWLFGYTYIVLTVTCITVNLLVTGFIAFWAVKGFCRVRKARKDAIKMMRV